MTDKKRSGPPPTSQTVNVHATEKFVAFQSLSGSPLARPEDGSVPEFLPADRGARELGAALLAALGRCRFVPHEDREFYSMPKRVESYAHSENEIRRRTGKRSKSDAYKNAIWCSVRRAEGQICIQPFRHAGRGTWKMLPEGECVVIPDSTDPDAVGVALALALERGRTFEG